MVWKNKAVQYGAVPVLVIIMYLFSRIAGMNSRAMIFYRVVVFCCVTSGIIILMKCFRHIEKGNAGKQEQITGILLILGIVLRVTFMLFTPCEEKSHDLGEIDVNGWGHAAYLLNIMQEGQLPQSNAIQFYQQPLFYLLGSFFSVIINGILGASDAYSLVDASKTVSCMASCISLLACREIFAEAGIQGKGLYRALMIVAFLPVYFLTGSSVGPDALAGMFMLLGFLYTMKWDKCKSWKNTILLAVIYGCGVLTKISCATLALFTAIIFVRNLADAVKKGGWEKLLAKYLVFGGISLPIGLWYSVRNYILFEQPLNYVLRIGEDHPLYTGNHSFVQRLLVIPINSLFEEPYGNVFEDYNLPGYALKSALFGEGRTDIWGWIPVLLLTFAFLLAVFSAVSIVYCIKYQRKDKWCRWMLLSAGIFWCSIVIFYIQYPFGCSMDFRYMLFLPTPVVSLLGRCEWFQKRDLGRYVDICCFGFAISVCLMYF